MLVNCDISFNLTRLNFPAVRGQDDARAALILLSGAVPLFE